jgi:hypothetical protein
MSTKNPMMSTKNPIDFLSHKSTQEQLCPT